MARLSEPSAPASAYPLRVNLARPAARALAAQGIVAECEALAAMGKIVQAEWRNPMAMGPARPMES